MTRYAISPAIPITAAFLPPFFSGDEERNAEDFQFNSILDTEIAVQLETYDLRNTNEHDLSSLSPEEREGYQAREPANAVLTLQRKDSKERPYTAAIGPDGTYVGRIRLAGHQRGDYILSIHKPGYQSRQVEIENLIGYARIDRVMPIASLQQAVVTDPDTIDSDGDTIPNIYDAFPNDPNRAFQRALADDDFLTVAYEDNYPEIGDADYNDYVVRYQVIAARNAQNQIVELYGVVEPVYMNTILRHSFGIYIRFPQNQGELIIRNTNHEGQLVRIRAKRVANAADIVVYPNTKASVSFVLPEGTEGERVHSYSYSYSFNRQFSEAQMYGHRAYFNLRFDAPVDPSEIDPSPYDPYLKRAFYDTHLVGKQSLPGSANPAEQVGFRDAKGYPWALLVPRTWAPPTEENHITAAYPNFTLWRTSRGLENTDWYLNPQAEGVNANAVKVAPEPGLSNCRSYQQQLLGRHELECKRWGHYTGLRGSKHDKWRQRPSFRWRGLAGFSALFFWQSE